MVKEEDEDWHNGCVDGDDHRDFLRGIRGWRMSVPRLCDVCQVSSSAMFCRTHRAHLCMVCDVKIHGGGERVLSSSSSVCHERVWLCEVCEQAPASVTCEADAAALCVACDSDIHSANPLARRHERIPVTPFYESPNLGNTNNNKYILDCNNMLNEDDEGDGQGDNHLKDDEADDDEEEEEALLNHRNDNDGESCYGEEANTVAASWLIPEVSKNNFRVINGVSAGEGEDRTVKDKLKFKAYLQSIDFLQDVDDPYVGLEFLASHETTTANASDTAPTAHMGGTDSMVPVHIPEGIENSSTKVSIESGSWDGEVSKGNYFRSLSLNHSVSSPSIDVGIVPQRSLNEVSVPGSYNEGRGSYEIPLGVFQLGTQFETTGREARVLRYREKRKNRKFEKTIRYASRKAYAETRPRIKGRFAKRTDVEEGDGEMKHLYSSSSHRGYGVVPSF